MFLKEHTKAGDLAQLIEYLPTIRKPWIRFLAPHKASHGMHVCNHRFPQKEAKGS